MHSMADTNWNWFIMPYIKYIEILQIIVNTFIETKLVLIKLITNLLRWLLNHNGHHYDANPIDDDVAYVFFSDDILYKRDRLGTRRRLGLILLGRRSRRVLPPKYL